MTWILMAAKNACRDANAQHEPLNCGDKHKWYLPVQDKLTVSVKVSSACPHILLHNSPTTTTTTTAAATTTTTHKEFACTHICTERTESMCKTLDKQFIH